MLTAAHGGGVERGAERAGADLFLTKPFSPLELLRLVDRLGAPYVTHRRPGPRGSDVDETALFGLGLGFFIAKTLLERSGAKLSLINQAPPLHGATITVTWNRNDFETPLTRPPLEAEAVAS